MTTIDAAEPVTVTTADIHLSRAPEVTEIRGVTSEVMPPVDALHMVLARW